MQVATPKYCVHRAFCIIVNVIIQRDKNHNVIFSTSYHRNSYPMITMCAENLQVVRDLSGIRAYSDF